MHLTIQQLKLFEAVSRNNSFTRAAKELRLSQPAVSIQVKRLEAQVGSSLFEQIGKNIYPTAAGKALYQASIDILSRIEELKLSLEEIEGVVKGPLQISMVTTTKYFMPDLLGNFLQEHPDVDPRLLFTNRAAVLERLYNNLDDFVVMGQVPEDPNLIRYPFLENILVTIAPPNHPLAGEKNISMDRLSKERFLEREQGSGTRLVFDSLLEENRLSIKSYMELGSTEAVKQGVMAGLGIAVLSLHSIQFELESGRLKVLDVSGFPLKRRWYIVHMKGHKPSLSGQTFLQYMLNNGEQIVNIDYRNND
jgi:DNA-binding transcriptional LysR family regulator